MFKIIFFCLLVTYCSFSQNSQIGFGYTNIYNTKKEKLEILNKFSFNEFHFKQKNLIMDLGVGINFGFGSNNLLKTDNIEYYYISLPISTPIYRNNIIELSIFAAINYSNLDFIEKIQDKKYHSIDSQTFFSSGLELNISYSNFSLILNSHYSSLLHSLDITKRNQTTEEKYYQGDWDFSGIKFKTLIAYDFDF